MKVDDREVPLIEGYGSAFVLIAAMQPRARVSGTDIYQHTVKKRGATEAGPSRPKKDRTAASSASRESDLPSTSVLEPVLVLSDRTVLPEVPSVEGGTVEDYYWILDTFHSCLTCSG